MAFMSKDEGDEDQCSDTQTLIHHHNLQSKLDIIIKAVQNNLGSKVQLVQLLLDAREDTNRISNFFSNHIQTVAYNDMRRVDSTTASRVFDIAEMAELILGHVDTAQVWKMYEVSRGLRDIIEASANLQLKLWLKPAPSTAEFQILETPDSDVDISTSSWPFFPFTGTILIQVIITIDPTKRRLFSSFEKGSRRKKILICQPPVTEMSVSRALPREHARDASGRRLKSKQMIQSPTGFTIGQLYDMAQQIARSERTEKGDANMIMSVVFDAPAVKKTGIRESELAK